MNTYWQVLGALLTAGVIQTVLGATMRVWVKRSNSTVAKNARIEISGTVKNTEDLKAALTEALRAEREGRQS